MAQQALTRLWHSKWQPYIVYGLVTSAIMLPLLRPGYILTLDMVFTPRLPMPEALSSSYLFRAVLHVLSIVIPGDIIQKILLCTMLFLVGFGMHRFAQCLWPRQANQLGQYIAGALYMINPFTYSRFMAGQYSVLLGYALLPFFARSWLTLLNRPTPRRALTAAIWIVAISIVSIHTLGPVFILALVGLGLEIYRSRQKSKHVRALLKLVAATCVIVLIMSAYWLGPLVFGHGQLAESINHFDTTDRSAFATEGGSAIGQLANSARLQGFWVEGQGLYALPQERMPAWGLLALVLWGMVIIGGLRLWRNRQRFTVAWLSISALFAALAATEGVGNWLAQTVPFFGGFREPHKFVMLVALAYAAFAGQGTERLVEKYRPRLADLSPYVCGAAMILLIVALTPTLLWGLGGQLQPRHYPTDWSTLNDTLNRDEDEFQSVFLPWHLYAQFDFSGRIIAHPAPDYFDKPMIVSDDPEYAGVQPANENKTKQAVSYILSQADKRTDLGAQLAPLRVKYVILSKDQDAERYAYLDHQQDLRLVTESASLKLYQNQAILGDSHATR